MDGLPLPYGTHLCALYATDLARTRLAASFLTGALREGTVSFLVAAPAARDAVLSRLVASRLAIEREIEQGRIVPSDYADSASAQIQYWETGFRTATRAGARSLRVVGDVWGLASVITREELIEYEATYERSLARRFPVVTLCQYDARRFSGIDVVNALRSHADGFRYPSDRLLA